MPIFDNFVSVYLWLAVGIKCEIPGHNLEEVVNALKVIVKKGDEAKVKDILKYIKGPDYAYGGRLISTPDEVKSLYETGQGILKYECEYTVEKYRKNMLLTITGYCPGFNPDTFIKKMMELIDKGIVVYVNLELLGGSQAPRRAVCGTRGSLRTMHGGGWFSISNAGTPHLKFWL